MFCFSENECAWKDDMEFGRQMLAGTHPVRIQCLKVLHKLMNWALEIICFIMMYTRASLTSRMDATG